MPGQTSLVAGRQLKAARALIGIAQRDLARMAGLHVNSVRYLEGKQTISSSQFYSAGRVVAALAALGVDLTTNPGPGVVIARHVSQQQISVAVKSAAADTGVVCADDNL